jgi:CubicO group peptidase (beta-lactamase class C family)
VTDLGGFAEPGYGPVADALASTFDHGDLGAGCALYVDGLPVVDLWGGVADKASGRAWDRDTLTLVFSVTKGVSSICAHMLVERGQLDLDAPVTTYWPEFGAAGKGATTVRDVLSHRTGLPVVDGPVTLEDLADPAGMAARMAVQAPLFEPGTQHVYQAVTFSWTFGEIIRRITGETLGTFVARELTGPLGLDLYVGLPPELEARVSTIEPPDAPPELVALVFPEGSLPWRAITLNGLLPVTMAGGELGFNSPEIRQVQLPAANGITNARSLARLYAATIGEVDGIRLLRPETVAAASVVRSEGKPWGEPFDGPTWGTGFLRPFPRQPMLGGASFGHDGAGGSIAFAEPDLGIAFSHVINRMIATPQEDRRTAALTAAVRECVERRSA